MVTAGCAAIAPPAAAQSYACAITAIVAHRAGSPTLLRVAPAFRAKARAAVPWRRGRLVAVIKEGRGGWFRVTAVRNARGRLALKAGGWLHGSRLALRVKSIGGKGIPLYEAATPKARVDVRINPAVAKRDRAVLLACKGGWARVRIGRVIGWLPPDNQCARPFGACK